MWSSKFLFFWKILTDKIWYHVHGHFLYFARAKIDDHGNFFQFFMSEKIFPRKKKIGRRMENILHLHYSVGKWRSIFRQNAQTIKKSRYIISRGVLYSRGVQCFFFMCTNLVFESKHFWKPEKSVFLSHFFRVFNFFSWVQNLYRAKYLFSRKITLHISN